MPLLSRRPAAAPALDVFATATDIEDRPEYVRLVFTVERQGRARRLVNVVMPRSRARDLARRLARALGRGDGGH